MQAHYFNVTPYKYDNTQEDISKDLVIKCILNIFHSHGRAEVVFSMDGGTKKFKKLFMSEDVV